MSMTIDLPEQCEALMERVQSAIQSNPFVANRNLRFETREGRVILRGKVGSYFQKQMAQEALRRVDGVEAIENYLEVTSLRPSPR
jgi:osmotically-inducible protein OsmY